MQLFDNIRMAFGALWSNKMRSLLTMLGIIIGIGSVIAIVTLGDSLTGSLTDTMAGFGINNITVSLQQKSESLTGNVRMFFMDDPEEKDLMTDAMIDEFRTVYADQIAAIALTQSVGSGSVAINGSTVNVMASGVNADSLTSDGLTMLYGRYIKDDDQTRQVAVVSDKFCEKVFGAASPAVIGKSFEISISGRLLTFYVVGVYEYDDSGFISMTGDDPTTNLYMPLDTARKLSAAAKGYQSFTVMAASSEETNTFLTQTEAFFASFYTRNETYTATASSMASMLESVTEMLATVQLAIAAIAAISLLVGGIGVMNIMLVSITERTREIGTRKALGAPGYAIRMQFITEAVVICLVGGALGIALGIGLGAGGAALMGYAAKPSISAIAMAFGFSMAIGVFFGYFPAGKAAKMNPIDALRYE